MATEISICNRALRLCGGQPIASFQDRIQSARDCAQFYPESRDQSIRDFDWNFARKRLRLTRVEIPDGYGQYDFMYLYPSDCLEIRQLRSDTADREYGYEVGALQDDTKVIMTNLEQAILVYSARVTDSERFDDGFDKALVLLLAAKLTWSITKSRDKEMQAFQKYRNFLSAATTADKKESRPTKKDTDSWVKSRRQAGVRFRLID